MFNSINGFQGNRGKLSRDCDYSRDLLARFSNQVLEFFKGRETILVCEQK